MPIPMVVEAHSGDWGPAATKIWLKLGKDILLVSGESTAVEVLRARQNLGLALHRETAMHSEAQHRVYPLFSWFTLTQK